MFRVQNFAIDLNELMQYVTDAEAGAIATFIGTTRNNNEGRNVIALDYEAYPEMAEKELARIGTEAAQKWQIRRMAIVHRLGPVQIGEASVIIAVQSVWSRSSRLLRYIRGVASSAVASSTWPISSPCAFCDSGDPNQVPTPQTAAMNSSTGSPSTGNPRSRVNPRPDRTSW